MPAVRMTRDSSTSKAPRSQNTSIHRACGRAGRQHRSRHQLDVAVAVVAVFDGHDVRTEKGCLAGELPRDGQRPRLVVDGQPVAALGLEGRDSGAEQFVRQPRRRLRVSVASSAARVAATVVAMPPAA